MDRTRWQLEGEDATARCRHKTSEQREGSPGGDAQGGRGDSEGGSTQSHTSQGALRRPRRSEEVEGPGNEDQTGVASEGPVHASHTTGSRGRWHLKGGACPRQPHNGEQGTGGHLGPKATLRVARGKAPPLLCLWKINLGLKRRRVQFGKWGCRDGNWALGSSPWGEGLRGQGPLSSNRLSRERVSGSHGGGYRCVTSS
ncbi:hypothetical protein D623_10012740 [Myotis brandtii]|uniref:Uncharacterized protein n=1 Tax=Myotis brandtii TaxID=109478 RepID=S7N2A3_MYOBR|nr:hypothetical protein D623_10012740 [Myotis brandtii]